MTTQEQLTAQEQKKPTVIRSGGGMDAVYGIGMIGAWVYYFKRAATPPAARPGLPQRLRVAGLSGLLSARVP